MLLGSRDAAASRYDPYGDAALHALFVQGGYEATWRLRGLSSLDASVDVLVLDLSVIEPSLADGEVLRGWVEGGGLLIAGGDASPIFPEFGAYWEDEEPSAVPATLPEVLASLPAPRWPGGPQAGYADRAAVDVVPLGNGAVLAVADARLLRNGALVHPDNEAFWLAAPFAVHEAGLVTLPFKPRLEMATRAGENADNPWSALRNARMLPFVLHALVLTALLALWKGWPFAVPRDGAAEGRAAFRAHVEALASQYARLGASRHAARGYCRLWLARLGRPGLVAAARRAGMPADRATDWAASIANVAESPSTTNDGRDLDRVEELWNVVRRS
jgi:hypothetical protein